MPTPPSFKTKLTLAGKLVALRPVTEADATALAATDAETLRLTGSNRTISSDELRAWYRTRVDHNDRLDLSIVEAATGRWIGEVVLNDLNPINRSCGFRILIASESDYDRHFGREATELVLAHAFDTVGLHRVELEVYQFNPRAKHVYEKIGFVYESTKCHAPYWDGDWVDADVMAMLDSDWSTRAKGVP